MSARSRAIQQPDRMMQGSSVTGRRYGSVIEHASPLVVEASRIVHNAIAASERYASNGQAGLNTMRVVCMECGRTRGRLEFLGMGYRCVSRTLCLAEQQECE